MNIRSDPMATWERAKQVEAPLNFTASVMLAHYILGSSRKNIDRDGKFATNLDCDADR